MFPLHKGGECRDLNNYRSISKLSCQAKTLESFLNRQFHLFLSRNCILNHFQSCFRPDHSTVSATSLVLNYIICALDNGQQCIALFIELSIAFDTVDHSLFIDRLAYIGLDQNACQWFTSYHANRTQCISQSSILGPLLFTLYINNIVPFDNGCKVHFYANDTVLYSFALTLEGVLSILQTAFESI